MSRKVTYSDYVPGHFEKIEAREEMGIDQGIEERVNKASSDDRSVVKTIFCEGHPIAVVGITMMWPGVAELWSVTTPHVKKTPKSFHRCVLDLIKSYGSTYHRLQLTVRCEFPEAVRYAFGLGFKCEGLMRKYGPDGSDHLLFGRSK